jgi:hypothetical protein
MIKDDMSLTPRSGFLCSNHNAGPFAVIAALRLGFLQATRQMADAFACVLKGQTSRQVSRKPCSRQNRDAPTSFGDLPGAAQNFAAENVFINGNLVWTKSRSQIQL